MGSRGVSDGGLGVWPSILGGAFVIGRKMILNSTASMQEIYEIFDEIAKLRQALKEAKEIIDTEHPDEICVVDSIEKCMLGKKKCPNCRRKAWLAKWKEIEG